MFWSTGLCRISRGKRWHISAPESFKGLTNALLVKNYLVSKIVKSDHSSSIWFLFLGLLTLPHSYLCILFCFLHPLFCLLRSLPIDLDRGSSIAIRQNREYLTTQVVGIPSQRFCLQVIETTVTKTSVFPSVFTSQTTREISLRWWFIPHIKTQRYL